MSFYTCQSDLLCTAALKQWACVLHCFRNFEYSGGSYFDWGSVSQPFNISVALIVLDECKVIWKLPCFIQIKPGAGVYRLIKPKLADLLQAHGQHVGYTAGKKFSTLKDKYIVLQIDVTGSLSL